MKKAEQRALEAYPRDDDRELNFRRANYRIAYERGYEQALKDIGIVNELIDQKGVAIVDTIDNYSGHQTDAMLDDPKMRIAIQNHSEEEYYQKVLNEYRLHQTKEGQPLPARSQAVQGEMPIKKDKGRI